MLFRSEQSLPQSFGFGEGLEVVHIHYHQSGGLRQAVAPSAGEYAAGGNYALMFAAEMLKDNETLAERRQAWLDAAERAGESFVPVPK